jgi:hypothetical protein
MKRLPAHTWLRFAVITAAALCALAGLSGTATASCGDYVSVRDSHPQPSHDVRPAPETSAPTDPARAVPPVPCRQCPAAPGQRPCRGPWCGNSEAPLTPPLAPVEPGFDTWACWWLPAGSTDPGSARLAPDGARSAPIHHPAPIFHPPRPV